MKKCRLFCFIIALITCLSSNLLFAKESNLQYSSNITSDVAALPAVDDTIITNGIKQFQQYINNNLPSAYLGSALEIDGRCGPLTKTAIIKLIQYRLNQSGANLSIDGGFGTLSQSAFSTYVGTINRYDSGNWVYILQGLLYCHGYDPNGFDGSYGVNGGTGCFNAVNNFKRDNVINEGSENSGTVGITTMKCLVWRNDIRILPDGMYYLKNAYSQKYLNVQNGGISTGTNVNQASKLTNENNLRQLWKITYVGEGFYSLRPMHRINQSLANFADDNVGLFDISLTDNLTTVVSGSRWKIVEASNGGYNILWYADSNQVVSLESNTTAENANVVVAAAQGQDRARWILEKKDSTPVISRIFIENSFKGYFPNPANSARDLFSKAITPFSEFMNYEFRRSFLSFPYTLTSDLCQHGYYDEITAGTCCTLGSCSHNTSSNAQCKCTYRIYESVYNAESTAFQLKTCFFTFNSCFGGLGGVGGDTTVVLIDRNTDTGSTGYMNSVRRIQHEFTHNLGGQHQEAGDMCTGRCINNGGFDNVYDYELSCIWCNRCLEDMNINKY